MNEVMMLFDLETQYFFRGCTLEVDEIGRQIQCTIPAIHPFTVHDAPAIRDYLRMEAQPEHRSYSVKLVFMNGSMGGQND